MDENDDYFREEGRWKSPEYHRRLLTEEISQLRSALEEAVTRLNQARDMGCDATDAQFMEMVKEAMEWDEE